MNGAGNHDGVILRIDNGRLIRLARIGEEDAEKEALFREIKAFRPACVETAIQYPGLLSVSHPRRACQCPLNTLCGEFNVQTLRVNVPSACADCVLVFIQPDTPEPPQTRKRDMLDLASSALGEPVRLSGA